MGIKLCDIDYINSEFKKVSLSINTGEIIGIIGDNSLLYSLLNSLKNDVKIVSALYGDKIKTVANYAKLRKNKLPATGISVNSGAESEQLTI